MSFPTETPNKEKGKIRSDEWYTPEWIFKGLNVDFDLDPFSPGKEIVSYIPATTHMTKEEDGLSISWFDKNVYMNCPYSKILQCVSKFIDDKATGIVFSYNRTETRWGQKLLNYADAVYFFNRRIKSPPGKEITEHPSFSKKMLQSPQVPHMLCAKGIKYVRALRNLKEKEGGIILVKDTTT